MKRERTKKITLSISILAVVTAIITVVALLVNTQNKKAKLLADPEIQKSMEYEQVQEGDEKVPNTDYVQFDAFFLRDLDGDGYAEQVRGMCRDINKTDTLYMNLNVLTNGKLVDGKITIKTSNMNLSTAIVEDNVIKQNYISNNTTEIALKDINNGTQKLIYGTVNASNFGNDINKYSQVNSVVLTGKHIADDGTETQISKTVDFNVDWYGSVTASIYNYTGTQNIEEITDENKENITLNFSVTTRETTDDLILKKAVLEGNIPTVNGYKPTSVELTSSDVNFEYDEETGNFTITREASINEAGIVTKTVSDYNTFTFKVTYPYELYESLTGDTLSLQVPVKAYYEGFNNPNDEFQNPVQSNIAERNITFLWRKTEGSVARFDVTIGKYRGYDGNYIISKEEPLKIYNGTAEETEDLYEVRWYAYTGNQINVDSIQMKENSTPYTDRFLNTESTYFNMSDYTKNTGIYFSNIENTLGEDGYIKVINDETGEEIHTFTKEDWNNYSSSSPYMYAEPVKHIRIETSKANKNASFYVYNIKEIDDNVLTATFTKEEFDKLEYVYTYLTGNVKTEGTAEYTKINDDTANARYEEPIAVASITVNRDTIGTQNTEKDIDLTITTRNDYYNMKGWTNGRFLVELPEEVLDVEINSVNISNSSVKLLAYEIVEQDGKKFIKIETENENEANYTITINTNLTADPRSVTQSKSVKLYAYNEFCNNYKNTTADIYDVDGDENVTENVNYATDTLNIVALSSLLTNQQATNYNEAGETAVAPQIATIDKTEADTATVNVSVTNNFSGTISEVSILGKIPFKGNTFSINGTDLGSNYTTQMVDGGITVPEDMKDKVTVYYSEKENPTTDLNDGENGWTTTPDFSKVKTYLIDLGDYVLNVKENRVFTYQIKVPSTVSYNDVSYSTHAVYFCLDTAEGKFKTQTETTKLGFRIERKYHLNMQKVKEDTTVPVQGATFSITAEGEDETKLGTTNNSGTFTIQNLFVDKTYILKEIRTPGSYEKNETEVKFKVIVQDDKLVLQILEGQDSLKEYNITQATTDSRGILNFKVENTPKYKVILTKKDNTDGSLLAGVKYKLEEEGLGNGITVATNKEGTLTLTGLSHDVEYTLTETEAKDYYVNETPVKFKVVNNSGKLEFVVTSGSFNSNSQVTTGTGVTGLDAQDTVTAELTNEKIPTYQVSVKKFAKEEDTTLKGAQYKITGEGIDEKGATYTTDETGVLTIPNLYEYVEGKNITGVYTLQEITPPEGYALDSRELQFRVKRNTEGALELEILGDNFLRNSSVQDNTINLEFEDEPLFKITKIDGATKLPIQNAKFVIKEIDESYNELGFAKDINGNVVGTLEENVGAGSITFPLDEEIYPWSKLEDGTYQSGISGLTSKTSTMTSKEFTLEKDGNISFEWAVSAESASYDYVYYTITNTKDNSTIGGTSTKIGGNKNVTDYNDLSFETVTEELEAGTYKIAFTYRTDSSNSYGLDSGFVKNIKVEGMNTQIPVVKTDENGEISYGLKAGLYKATEIEAPEGYEFAENEADRTYYFGIGASKAQETEFGTSFNASVAGDLWNKVEAVESTTDNGFVTSGYFTKEADLNNDGLADVKGNVSYYSGFIAKYNKEGNMEIANSVYTESGEVILHKVIQTNDGGYVVGGSFTGTNLQVGEVSTGLTNTTNDLKGIVIKLSSSGSYEWAKEVAQEGLDYDVTALTQNLEGNIVAGVTTGENPKVIEYTNTDGSINGETTISANVQISDMDGYNSQDVIIVSQGLTDTTTGRIDLYSNGSVTAGSELDFNANAVARLDNGKAIIVGNYTGTAQTVKTKGNYDGIIIEYDINSSTINSSKFIRGTLDEVLTSVTKTTDGGYMIGGYTYSSQVDFNQEETTWEIPSISGDSDGFVIKYDSDGNQAWYKQVTGDNLDEVTGVAERDENEFVAVGYFNSTTVKGDTADSQGASLSKYSDGFVFNYGEIITAPEVPESSEITIENNLKKFQITTDVEEVNGVKGGTITGEDEAPYEVVEYGKDSTKEIKIVPDENYKIVKITVNGENYEFTPAEDGSFTMPQFTNMQTNKHIVVTFSNTASSVLVHHYVDGTQTKVAEDEHIAGTIGESYTTAPHMDLEEYELKQVDGEYVIPDNASGTFTQEEQVITYYYVKKQVPLTVHHYIEGTNEQVPLASGELAQDVVTKGEIGTEYTTVALTPEELNPKYELSITPSNANGIYSKDGIVVTYYYKAKNVEVTTTVQTHKETNEMGEEVDVAGGTISGQNQKPYETVVYGEDSKNDIVAIPDENYQVKQILINGEPLEFTPEEDGTVILNKFTDMTEDKHVVVEFEKIPAKVIVHYYIEGTTNKVPLQDGGTAEDVTQTGVVGDIYATKEAVNVNNKYELVAIPTNASGTMTRDTIVVIYYYKLKETSVIVHHYIDGTENKVPSKDGGVVEDETMTGKVDDTYTTKVSTNIANNYEVIASKLPANASGTMTVEQIVVTYYYQLKTPTLESNISKTSTLNKVTEKDEEIPYTITYTANIDTYIGDAEVIIVDTLPYEIDEASSDLAGGEYNATAKTITWKETITGIDTFANIKKQVNITKEIKVKYKNLDVTQANVTNKVTGTINLKTPAKTDVAEATKNIPTEFKKAIKVTKVWNDNNNIAEKRPANVTLVLTGDSKTYKQQLTSANAVAGDTNTWEYTFVDLPKYDTTGNEIAYVLSEENLTSTFYTSSVNQEAKTVTNTFNVPDQKITVTVHKAWDDNSNSAGKRPTEVTLTLTGTGEGINITKEQKLTSANVASGNNNVWEYTFVDLPKYDNYGDEVEYTVNEKDLNTEFYIKSSVEQTTKTVTNTFQVPGDKVEIPVTKIWDDNNDEAKKRPASVTLQVKNGTKIVAEETVTEADEWKHTFSVPKYDENGDVITYTIAEKDLGNIFYTAENTVIDQEAKTITNKFVVPDEKISIPVTKIWDDNNNSVGKRPEKVTMVLTATTRSQSIILSEFGAEGEQFKHELTAANAVEGDSNTWEYVFTDLPKYDKYGNTLSYELTEELDSIYYKENYRDDLSYYTITNTFKVPADKISIPVVKVWNDNNNTANKRPDNVVLVLTGNDGSEARKVTLGGQYADPTNGNRWLYTFTDLPKYNATNGDEIVYTLSEEKINSKFYTTSVNQETKTVTNTFSVPDEKVPVTVSKVWNDNNNSAGKRPTNVTIAISGNGKTEKVTLNSGNVITNDNIWEYIFTDLPKYDANGDEIVYTIAEELSDEENNKFYTSNINQESKTITNTFSVPDEKVSVTVTKVWDDNSNSAGKRPTNITLKVTGNGQEYTKEITEAHKEASNSNNWKYTFTDLPKYDANGDEITYTIDEKDTNSKFYTKTSVNQTTKTIVNTFQVPGENVTIPVTKIWDDDNNKAKKRPESVTLQVKNGEQVVAEQPVTVDTEWKHEFTVPKYDSNGNEIVYTIDEADLNNKYYEKGNVDQTARTITNVSKYGKVTVHYYIMNTDGTTTTIRVPDTNGTEIQDVLIEGKQGENYDTTPAENVKQNYELVAEKLPANATGTITAEDTEVIYYYRLKTPSVTNNITKTGTDRITVANQEMSYTVTYTANVADYIGNAEVTIVDTLPYEIDEAKSDLAGGVYDSASKTITWKENVSDINSYTGNGTVNVTKTFKVVYVGLDINQEKVVNNVKGNIKLLAPEKTSEDTTSSFDTPIYKAIISSEKLVDKTEAIEGEKVTYTVRIANEGNLAKTVTVRDTLPAGITFDNDTLIQVGTTGTVYTEQNLKNGIPVEVPANGSIDVVFAGKVDKLASNEYSKTLTNQATVDNEPTNEVTTNVTKANITAHKEAEPVSGNKVRLGDEITYRIRVRNDGTREGTAIVKDTIPTGTTFVEGSVKIDNIADSTKTATDLANGITLNVPMSTEKVVEFKVTVNKLIDGTKIKNTAYINQNGEDKKVPEEPEHTYVEPKEEQSISKNGTATIESLNGEITYNINYTARITDYSGRATVKLVDKLPYAIDEAKSDLAGGTYDAQAQTITWEEAVEGIQLTEEKEVTINKTVKVVYIGISQETTAIKNVVTGHIEYETPEMISDEVTANWTTTTGFIVNIPVSKVWEDDSNKLGQRPTKVVFKLHGSDGSEYTKELAKPGTAGSTTTQDSTNPNKWNDIFENLPKYDENKQEIVYTLTEEEKTEGDLRYYDSIVTDKTVTNTNKYGKVTVHHYIMNTDGSLTTTRVPDVNGTEIPDVVIEGKEGTSYETEPATNINEKYELVAEKLPANATGTIEKYNEEKPQEVIYYYRLKPAKVLINYLEKDEDTDDSNNLVLTAQEKIDGHVDDVYNTDTDHRKETIEKDGKTYTLVSDSGNKTGNMTVQDITVTYYYLQNTKATVRYVERNPETHEIVKDLEEPTVKEGLVGDEFVTNSKDFVGYKLVESPEKTTIEMTKEEQTLIYYYEPVYTGLIENHIDDKTGKVLYTETHDVQVGEDYDIPSKEFEGYDLVESKLPENAKGTMGEELVTVNYYYIKKAVLEVNYIDKLTGEPLTEQIVDETKHEGDEYTTEQKTFENYDLIEVPENSTGTMVVETDEEGNITNNRTVVTYYYSKKSAGVEEHHIDIRTGEELEEPTLHKGHVGDEYDIKAKEFLSYVVATTDKDGNNVLPENATGTMTAEKIVVNYYYNQPAKVIVHYVEKATGKELEEINPETGELQNSQVVIEGFNQDEYETTAKEFEYYTLIESPEEPNGTMKVEIVKDEEGNDIVNNTIELYYYYEAKPFNIGVEKEITGIIVNGERRAPENGKLEKVEIYRKSTENTSVQVEYKIKVMNTGEVNGNATIEENIPEGMNLANNDGTWEEQEGKLIKVIPELGAGETKEYTVLLNWEQTGENMGEKANEAKLVETGNVPGFVDNNDKDNTSNANVIISVETGELPIGLILALVALVGLETVTLRYAVVLTKRQKKKVNKK